MAEVQGDHDYFPYIPAVPFRGDTVEEVKAHLAFEAQLRSTQDLLERTLTQHAHYTDDCGDALMAALELSSKMASARAIGGPEALLTYFRDTLAKNDEEVDSLSNYSWDGIAPEVIDIVKELGGRISMTEKEMIEAVQGVDLIPEKRALYLFGKFVERHGLFGKAFFGHKATKAERSRINSLWKRSLKLAGVRDEGQSTPNDSSRVPGPGTDEAAVGGGDQGSQEEAGTAGPHPAQRTTGLGEDHTGEHHSEGDGLAHQDDRLDQPGDAESSL